MDVFEAMSERYSYRGSFRDQMIPRDDLRRIVEAGLQAPSGKNIQTTRFVIVDDADLVRQIAEMPAANTAMQQAKAYVACIVDLRPEAVYEGHAFQVEDCAAAVENMLLAITALGYATVWIDGWLRVQKRAETIGELLGLPEGKIVRIILPLGVPEEAGPRMEKMPFSARAWFNRYGEADREGHR
ncbi:MAG: nitroreductase [bacterium]|nr:nitroreductase [bacterium]